MIVDKLIGLKRNDQRQRRETSVAPGAGCGGEGAAHRNFDLALCIKGYRRLAALPLGVGLIWGALLLILPDPFLFELSQILR